jgi:hypothetical protein
MVPVPMSSSSKHMMAAVGDNAVETLFFILIVASIDPNTGIS